MLSFGGHTLESWEKDFPGRDAALYNCKIFTCKFRTVEQNALRDHCIPTSLKVMSDDRYKFGVWLCANPALGITTLKWCHFIAQV